MKNSKKPWALTPKQKRKDNTKRKPYHLCPVVLDHSERRALERANTRKLLIGFEEEELFWPAKWQRYPDYYW
jgi:hypothetical protein